MENEELVSRSQQVSPPIDIDKVEQSVNVSTAKPKVLPGTEKDNPELVGAKPTTRTVIGGFKPPGEFDETLVVLLPEDTETITDGKTGRPIVVTKKFYATTEVKILNPKTDVAPKPFKVDGTGAVGYKSRLSLTYADSEYKTLLSNIKWFMNEAEINGEMVTQLTPSFIINRKEEDLKNSWVSEVEKLYIRYCLKNTVPIGSVTHDDFITDLNNYEFKLSQYYDPNSGEPKRLDIYDFRLKQEVVNQE